MVVHFQDAGLADSAVVAAVGLVLVAPLAMTPFTGLLPFLHGHGLDNWYCWIYIPLRIVFWDFSRTHQYALDVARQEHTRQPMKYDKLDYRPYP